MIIKESHQNWQITIQLNEHGQSVTFPDLLKLLKEAHLCDIRIKYTDGRPEIFHQGDWLRRAKFKRLPDTMEDRLSENYSALTIE